MKQILIISSLILTAHALALPTDQQQDVEIQASQFEMDENKGITTYTGNVLMQQGSMKIKAEKVVFHSANGHIVKIIATGRTAEFEQIPKANSQPVIAKAERLEYITQQETLRLIGNASLIQEGATLSGNQIDYDVNKSIVKADSASNQNKAKNPGERVKLVIPAKQKPAIPKQTDTPNQE